MVLPFSKTTFTLSFQLSSSMETSHSRVHSSAHSGVHSTTHSHTVHTHSMMSLTFESSIPLTPLEFPSLKLSTHTTRAIAATMLLQIASIVATMAAHHLQRTNPFLVAEPAVAVGVEVPLHVLEVLLARTRTAAAHAEVLHHLWQHLDWHESVSILVVFVEDLLCVALDRCSRHVVLLHLVVVELASHA